jgi:hypothetical protein
MRRQLVFGNLVAREKKGQRIMFITPIEIVPYTAKAHTPGGREGGASRSTDLLENTILKGKIAMPETIKSLYDAETRLAERELSAFITAVTELFGPVQAKLSAEDWLVEFELEDRSPRSVTVAASARLANRLNIARQTLSVTLDKGGHFAAWEQTQLFAAELRAAFKSVR